MFENAFRDIVLTRAQRDHALSNFPETKLCGNARGPFDTLSSVLCYCLCYQHTHFASLSEILRSGRLDEADAPLVLDIGAGPATVPLALAERHVRELRRGPLALRYIDVERSDPMRETATAFLGDAALFRDVRRIALRSLDDLGQATVTAIQGMVAESDAIVVALSFVLKQPFVDEAFARHVASTATGFARSSGQPTYVLVQDVSHSPYERYDAFFDQVSKDGYRVDEPEGRLTQPHRQMLLNGTIPDQPPRSNGNVVYRLGRLLPAP